MSNRVYHNIGLMLVFTLALPGGALAIFESAATIKGSVKDERGVPYQECRLELLRINDQRILDYRPISAEFFVTFVLAPQLQSYLLRIACTGSDETFITEPKLLGSIETLVNPVDLGGVRLKRRGGS